MNFYSSYIGILLWVVGRLYGRWSWNLRKITIRGRSHCYGLPSFSSRNSIYCETGWEPLSNRRSRRKLQLFYKIHHGLTPTYLQTLLPSIVADNTQHLLRNAENYTLPNNRLESSNISFFPSTVRLWNQLPINTRHSEPFSNFKHAIQNQDVPVIPDFFYFGDRKLNIIHTNLRNRSSSLRSHLFRANIVTDQKCHCGFPVEDPQHFFFNCNSYNDQRIILFRQLNSFIPLSVNLLLFGNMNLSTQENELIFMHTQQYIKDTHRF